MPQMKPTIWIFIALLLFTMMISILSKTYYMFNKLIIYYKIYLPYKKKFYWKFKI